MNEHVDGSVLYTRNEAAAEALLFASGGVITPENICLVLKVTKNEALDVMSRLSARYKARRGGIILREVGEGWNIMTIWRLIFRNLHREL